MHCKVSGSNNNKGKTLYNAFVVYFIWRCFLLAIAILFSFLFFFVKCVSCCCHVLLFQFISGWKTSPALTCSCILTLPPFAMCFFCYLPLQKTLWGCFSYFSPQFPILNMIGVTFFGCSEYRFTQCSYSIVVGKQCRHANSLWINFRFHPPSSAVSIFCFVNRPRAVYLQRWVISY